MKRIFVLAWIVGGSSVGCGTSANSGYLDVGGEDAGNGKFQTSDAGGAQGLDAFIEEGQVAVKLVRLSCSGDCATVMAVGTGGTPPYTYAWENGSTDPVRQLCPTADGSYSVRVTDTGGAGENFSASQTVAASVTADVLACPDGGEPDAMVADGGDAGAPGCGIGDAGTSVGTVTPDIDDNMEAFFEGGASLPAGRYAVAYAGGCVNYSQTDPAWTVNGQSGLEEYWIAGASTADHIATAPGTWQIVLTPAGPPSMSFQNPGACVTANETMDPPYVFDFAGGQLGIYNDDFEPSDNQAAPSGAPSFTLFACP